MNRQIVFRFFMVLAFVGMVSEVCAEDAGFMKREKKAGKDKGKGQEQVEVADKIAGKEAAPALGDKDERDEELFKDLPIPEKRPRVNEVHLDAAKKRHSDLARLYDELGDLIRERHFLMQGTDEKQARKQKRELEKLDKAISRQKKELVKEAKKLRRPLDRKLEGYLKEKEAHDKKVESAEQGGNEKRAQKLAQEFARKGTRIEDTQSRIDCINYFLFWDDFVK